MSRSIFIKRDLWSTSSLKEFISHLKKAFSAWHLWLFLGNRDVKARFRRSFIGPLWIFLSTGFFVGGIGLVYGRLFDQDLQEFIPYITVGVVTWNYIVASLTEACYTFTNAEGYIKQFNFPRFVYPLRTFVTLTIMFLVGFIIIVPIQLICGRFSLLSWVLALPGFALLLWIVLGHILIFSYLSARFRDLPYAMGSLLQVLFFLTPVAFPVTLLRERGLGFVCDFNPFFYLIDMIRVPLVFDMLASSATYKGAVLYGLVIWLTVFLVTRKLDQKVVFYL